VGKPLLVISEVVDTPVKYTDTKMSEELLASLEISSLKLKSKFWTLFSLFGRLKSNVSKSSQNYKVFQEQKFPFARCQSQCTWCTAYCLHSRSMMLPELLLPFYLLQRWSDNWNQDCTQSPKYKRPALHEERYRKDVRIEMHVFYSFLYTQSHCRARKGIISLYYTIEYLFQCSHRIGGLGRWRPKPLSSPQ
jgi:hypothetical protein